MHIFQPSHLVLKHDCEDYFLPVCCIVLDAVALYCIQLDRSKLQPITQCNCQVFSFFATDKEEASYEDRPDVHLPPQNISTVKKADSVRKCFNFALEKSYR